MSLLYGLGQGVLMVAPQDFIFRQQELVSTVPVNLERASGESEVNKQVSLSLDPYNCSGYYMLGNKIFIGMVFVIMCNLCWSVYLYLRGS